MRQRLLASCCNLGNELTFLLSDDLLPKARILDLGNRNVLPVSFIEFDGLAFKEVIAVAVDNLLPIPKVCIFV